MPRYGIGDGDAIEVGNRQGAINLHAKFFDGLLPGVVVIESLWGNADFRVGSASTCWCRTSRENPMAGRCSTIPPSG